MGGVKLMEKDDWRELRDMAKETHALRVAKTPERIRYAIMQFQKYDIKFALKNESTGHFHCWRKSKDKLFQFWASTGKIQGYEELRGIHALIKILTR
jgi:hypothetical protein